MAGKALDINAEYVQIDATISPRLECRAQGGAFGALNGSCRSAALIPDFSFSV